jgi:hypothetical protein
MKHLVIMVGFITFSLLLWCQNSSAQSRENPSPIVLELFTSQNCLHCPDADSLLKDLAEEKRVIALSCHVTYRNDGLWQDTLSQEFCTEKQQAYSAEFGRDGAMFTPELVINGGISLNGAARQKVMRTIVRQGDMVLPVEMDVTADNILIATFPEDLYRFGDLSYYLLTYGNEHTQRIEKGENYGKTLSYINPAKTMRRLQDAEGSLSLALEPAELSATRGYVILVHQNANGRIIAAGEYRP